MVDLSQLFGGGGNQNDPMGLLTPQQQGDINQTTLQSIAAGLMKAGGPSPYKANMTALSGIGEALQGGIAARQQAQKDAVTQSYVRTQTMDKMLPIMQEIRKYQEVGIEPPPQLVNMARILSGMAGGAAPQAGGGAPLAGGGMTTAPAPGTPGAAGAPAAAVADSGVPHIMSMEEFARTHGFVKPGQPPYALMRDSAQHAALQTAYDKYQEAVSPERRVSEEDKAVTAGDVEHYGNQYVGIQAARRAGEKVLGLVDQAKAVVDLMEQTGYKPGGQIAPELQLAWRRFAANTGLGNPNESFAPEVFKKITQSALQGIQEEATATAAELKGSAGRNLLATVKLQLGASPSTDITIPSNRYLLDQMATHAQHSVNIGGEAAKYKTENKRLNEGWDIKEAALNKAHNEAQLKRLKEEGLAGMTQVPTAQAEGAQPIPGMMSPAGPGAGSNFTSITPRPATPGQPAAPKRPTMVEGRPYPSADGRSFITLRNGVITPTDRDGNPLTPQVPRG